MAGKLFEYLFREQFRVNIMTHNKNPFMLDMGYILTGTMGSGKSTLINALKKEKKQTIEEPARAILHEQRLIKARGLPEKDPNLFTQLLLSRAIHFYRTHQDTNTPIFFDRGLPDIIAYAKLFELDTSIYENAASTMRYNQLVFILPVWPEIYTTDEERKMTLSQCVEFDASLRRIYTDLGYKLIEVPKVPAKERAHFILEKLK